jgi:hypothetical protein
MNAENLIWEGMDWIHLAQDRDQWQPFVITGMNIH